MSYASKFFQLAIRESDCPDFNNDPYSLAAVVVMGAIGQTLFMDDSRDTFIKAGFAYLDEFPTIAARAIEDEQQSDPPHAALINAIRELDAQSKQVELAEFFTLLAQDWDERHDEE